MKSVLEALNTMEVIESGWLDEGQYVLVGNNPENSSLLSEIGINPKEATKYGDDETFCIFTFATAEGYANYWDGENLHNYDDAYLKIAIQGLKQASDAMESGSQSRDLFQWKCGFDAVIGFLEDNY